MALMMGNEWRPSSTLLHDQLKTLKKKPLNLELFPRGVDNAHIDVRLEPRLLEAIDALVLLSLGKNLQALDIQKQPPGVNPDGRARFVEVYSALSIRVAQKARACRQRELYQLFVLSVLKSIYLTVDERLRRYANELEIPSNALSLKTDSEAKKLDNKSFLFKQQQKLLRFLISQEVIEQFHGIELQLRKQRKGILALSWPVLPEMLFNPLLHLADLHHEDSFAQLYPLLFLQALQFRHFEAAVVAELSTFLPDCPKPLSDEEAQPKFTDLELRRDEGQFPGYAQSEAYLRRIMQASEYRKGHVSWFDDPNNVLWLFGQKKLPRELPWGRKEWRAFQQRLLVRLEERLQAKGLMEAVGASAILLDIYANLGKKVPIHSIFDYLVGRKKKDIPLLPLKVREHINESAYKARLEEGFVRLHQATKKQRLQWVAQALEGYARLRRDLKFAWETYRAMDLIRLLHQPEELELSIANRLLHDFILQQDTQEQPIRGHIILKADLRGSTQLIAYMLENQLNPAAYFSENLFDPINTLLRQYGAEKVFVEGDAVILMILEQEGQGRQVVARACGLAHDIIQLVKRRNRDNRLLGLPQLELGIGLAYVSEAPTYLFDEGRKITISPAINRADRLSSCSDRAFPGFARLKGRDGVMVLEPASSQAEGCGKDRMYRYNVNGIELDKAAFRCLLEELALRKVKFNDEASDAQDRFFIGRFPDLAGKTRWMMVRRGLIRRWDGKKACEGKKRHYYYELVTDGKLIRKVRRQLNKLHR